MSQPYELFEELKTAIQQSFEEGITVEAAERLAGKFLFAQMEVAKEIGSRDLDTRMKKAGLKAIKAAVYMAAATAGDKKPSDVLLQNLVDTDKIVQTEQTNFDRAEVATEELQNLYNIFREAHIHFRGIAKGSFQ